MNTKEIIEFIKNQKEDFWKKTLKMYEEMAKKEFIHSKSLDRKKSR